MSKKTLILCVSMVMALALGLGGTLAYLTDRDAQTNVFNIGNVDIKLTEDFQQGTKLIPGVDITKVVKVENVGDNDAWVWVTIAIPAELDEPSDASANGVHFNYAKESVGEGLWTWTDDQGAWLVAEGVKVNEAGGDDNLYNVYTVLYQTALKPGEITAESAMKNVYLDDHIDITPDGQLYHVENGVATKINWNVNENGAPLMYVAAYAIQKEGFDTVQDAYDAYGVQWGANGGVDYNTVIASPATGAVRPAGYEPPVEGGVIEGLTIVDNSDDVTNLRALYNEGSAKYVKNDLTINNSYFDGTYAMNLYAVAANAPKLVANNTTFKGWTSFTGWGSAEFNNCTFAINSEATYNMLRPYSNTTLNECELAGTTISLDNGSGSYNGATLTLKNCTMNGVAVTSVDQLTLEDAEWANYITISND